MDIQKIFPFYNSAPVINRQIEDRFDLTNLKYMKTLDLPKVILSRDLIEEIWKYYGNSRIDIIHLIPNDVYFYSGDDEILKILMNYYYEDSKKIPVMITNIDYKLVADNLTLINSRVLKQEGNGFAEVDNILSDRFIKDSRLVKESDSLLLTNLLLKETFKERRKFRLYSPIIENFDENQEIKSKNTSFISQIESYLRSDDITEQIPMLIGLSGIAKSAIVKSITEKLDKDSNYLKNHPYGMRLVDFRVAFMSALDINGMFSQIENQDKSVNTKISPTIEFFSCTDEYLQFARKMVKLLEYRLSDSITLNSKDRIDISKLLDKFRFESKTPVFFFDEITRSSSDIQGALSIIVNQRLYQQYHLNEARMIAATNIPYMNREFSSRKEREQFESKLANIFLRTNLKDVALVDKFKRIKISPEDVRSSWFSWAETNINSLVLDYLRLNPEQLYDVSPIVESSDEDLLVRKVIPAYPNYRTWENVSDYISYIIDNSIKEANSLIVSGLIGKSASKKFLNYFINKNPEIKLKEDNSLDTLVEDTLNANLPLMLVGVPGIGKTSRIKDYCNKYGYDRLVISLATMDRTELMGAATQRDFISQIGRESTDVLKRLDLLREVNQLKNSITDFPESLTIRSPRYDLIQRVKKSVDNNQTLVLVFDEGNRCLLGSTKIKLLDGTVKSLKELDDLYGQNEYFEVYSCDNEGNLKPGRARSLGVTRRSAELVKIVLDNNEEIICTPDHKIMLKDGTYKQAIDLEYNDSLMAAYFGSNKGRELISIKGKKLKFTHRLLGDYIHPNYLREKLVVHHIDRNKKNNTLKNLQVITQSEHTKIHYSDMTDWRNNPTDKQKQAMRNNMYNNFINNIDKREKHRLETILGEETGRFFRQSCKDRCNTDSFRAMRKEIATRQWELGQFDNIDRQSALIKNRSTHLIKFIQELMNLGYEVTSDNYEKLRKEYTGKNNPKKLTCRVTLLKNISTATSFSNIEEAIDDAKRTLLKSNHKVKYVEKLDYTENVYDLEVEEYHNFLVYFESDNSGVFVHNCIDPITQSVIFKAISDNEIFGIKFPKNRIRIVVIGNLSGGTTSGARAFDSALYARCVSYIQKEYSLEDVNSLLRYIKEKKYSKILIDFIEKKLPNSDEYVLDWLKSIDKASLLNNVPTSRSLKTLSDILKRPPNPQGDQFYGSIITTEEFQSDINNYLTDKNPEYELTLKLAIRIKEIISNNWAGLDCYKFYENKKSKFEYLLSGTDKSDKNAVKIFNDIIFNNLLSIRDSYRVNSSDESKKYKEAILWIKRFLEIDRDIMNYRRKIFEDIAGKEFTELFLPYYNEVSGRENIDLSITSILDTSLIPQYLESEMNYCYQEGTYKWSKIIELALRELRETYSDSNYLKLLNNCVDFDLNATGGAVENSRQELKELLAIKEFEQLIYRLEFKPSSDYYRLLNKLKYSREDYNRLSDSDFVGKAIYI